MASHRLNGRATLSHMWVLGLNPRGSTRYVIDPWPHRFPGMVQPYLTIWSAWDESCVKNIPSCQAQSSARRSISEGDVGDRGFGPPRKARGAAGANHTHRRSPPKPRFQCDVRRPAPGATLDRALSGRGGEHAAGPTCHGHDTTPEGHARPVRHGSLPEREGWPGSARPP